MADNHYFRISRQGLELELEGPKEFIDEMLDRFLAGKPVEPVGTDLEPVGPESRRPTRATSPSEFIRRLGFKKHTDKVLAFGYFLEQFRDQRTFTSSDINALYYEAKLEAPNTSQMLTLLVKRGDVMQTSGSGEGRAKSYTLTQSGEDTIQKALGSGE